MLYYNSLQKQSISDPPFLYSIQETGFRNVGEKKERKTMSGHSKFANIKHKKEKNDAKKRKNLYNYRP